MSRLTPYIYIFDFTSKDLKSLYSLASYADTIVVGGDMIMSKMRQFASPNTKIIE